MVAQACLDSGRRVRWHCSSYRSAGVPAYRRGPSVMAAIINTNIQSMNAQRNLSKSQGTLATSMQRLSSGPRINSAKDDAAGLAISERMTTQTRGLTVAARNANDGISLAQTAEGALGSITANLQRIRELAVQSRNATNNAEDRAALNQEVSQLKEEITRIARDTTFNGTKLLDGSFTNMAFQVGANQGQTIDVNSIVNANISQLGQWVSADTPAELSGTAPTGTVTVGAKGTGTIATNTALSFSGGTTIAVEINGVSKNLAADTQAAFENALKAEIGGNATVSVAADGLSVSVADYEGTTAVSVKLPDGAESKVGAKQPDSYAFAAGTVTINGEEISYGSATSVSQRTSDLAEAINKNATLKESGVLAYVSNGVLKIESRHADLVIAGADLAETGLNNDTTPYTPGVGMTGFLDMDVLSPEGADNAILAMDAALAAVNSARATLGAVQSRFQTTIDNLNITNENLTASKSRIMDADFAAETAALSAAQVLQQAGTAMVAQANQVPQTVLQLLQG